MTCEKQSEQAFSGSWKSLYCIRTTTVNSLYALRLSKVETNAMLFAVLWFSRI